MYVLADAYDRIIDDWATFFDQKQRFLSDFAILKYPYNSSPSMYEATTEMFFRVKDAGRRDPSPCSMKRKFNIRLQTGTSFNQVRSIQKIWLCVGKLTFKMIRRNGRKNCICCLTHTRDVIHLVFFTDRALQQQGAKEKLMELVRNIRDTLQK